MQHLYKHQTKIHDQKEGSTGWRRKQFMPWRSGVERFNRPPPNRLTSTTPFIMLRWNCLPPAYSGVAFVITYHFVPKHKYHFFCLAYEYLNPDGTTINSSGESVVFISRRDEKEVKISKPQRVGVSQRHPNKQKRP